MYSTESVTCLTGGTFEAGWTDALSCFIITHSSVSAGRAWISAVRTPLALHTAWKHTHTHIYAELNAVFYSSHTTESSTCVCVYGSEWSTDSWRWGEWWRRSADLLTCSGWYRVLHGTSSHHWWCREPNPWCPLWVRSAQKTSLCSWHFGRIVTLLRDKKRGQVRTNDRTCTKCLFRQISFIY